MKQVKRYNLDLNDNYEIVDSYHTGGLDNACTCDNCNKPISNVAVIKNSKNTIFNVGLDCAETLSNLKGLFNVQMEFKNFKALRSKIIKHKKQTSDISYRITPHEVFCVDHIQIPLQFAKKYFNDLLKNVANQKQLDYTYNKVDIKLPFAKCTAGTVLNLDETINYEDYTININVVPGKKLNGEHNGSYLFNINVSQHGKLIETKSTYMYTDIVNRIDYCINFYKLENL